MNENNNSRESNVELYDLYSSGRNPKVLKSPKGYDRLRERKSLRLYLYEHEEEEEFLNDIEQDS